MTIALLDGSDSVTLRGYELARARSGIGEHEILAVLLFGSMSREEIEESNDIDLILIISEGSERPLFSYNRYIEGSVKVDCNLIKISYINNLCQIDVGWSYRLYKSRILWCAEQEYADGFAPWLMQINQLVESSAAEKSRILLHLRDCRSLIRGANDLKETEPDIAKYLMVEAFFLLPVIYLNCRGIAPFYIAAPWQEALREAHSSADVISQSYLQLTRGVVQHQLVSGVGDPISNFGTRLKDLQDRCRYVIMRRVGNIFKNGYGAHVAKAIAQDYRAKREIASELQGFSVVPEFYTSEIWDWLNLIRRSIATNTKGRPKSAKIHRRKEQSSGPRHIEYLAAGRRLKAIIPTGGCRVPTCTFCMLPSLARPKVPMDGVIRSILDTRNEGPILQASFYTDGSFFDEREISREDRLRLVRTASELGAKELLVETLPRFIDLAKINEVVDALGDRCRLRIGVGLQSSDPLVRQFVTGTPISQRELYALREWRKAAPFTLRFYILANKPMLSRTEDRQDLHRTLAYLDTWLSGDDVVTVNPLLPTKFTLLERLAAGGFWRPLSVDELEGLRIDLGSKDYNFRLEYGSEAVSTCNNFEALSRQASKIGRSFCVASPDPADLPWSILGGLRLRNAWAKEGKFLSQPA